MKMEEKKAGTASAKSVQLRSLKEAIMRTPTMMRAGAVATDGTRLTKGATNMVARNSKAVTTEVRPVRPPTPIPAADST